jgi:hypothetical protein
MGRPSRSRTRSRLLVLAFLLLPSATASARLAVFVDGRVIKVTDAYLKEDRIVLVLKEGGRLEVPAVRVDRVVADEVEEPAAEAPAEPSPTCVPGWVESPLPDSIPFAREIEHAARTSDLHPRLLAAVVRAESAFNPWAVSRAGACGLTQLMPSAAADHGVHDPFDPVENLRGGAGHLRNLLDRFGALELALAAYNAGAATVERSGGIPPYRETRQYVRRVLATFCGPATGETGAAAAGEAPAAVYTRGDR